jgi:nitrogen fixation/metabolism regulation signal transduction histidine kinase
VIATQPEVDALDSIKKFNTIFWGSVIFTVLLILLISMVQIRRVLIPLEKLVDGIHRLESRDFNTKIPITSSDEFGELSRSFNAMSEKLGDQFQILSALSEIDREIYHPSIVHCSGCTDSFAKSNPCMRCQYFNF